MEELEPAALKNEHEAVSLTLARTRKNWLANHPAKNHTRGLRYIILKIIHCEVGTMLKAYLCYIFSKTFIVQCSMLLFISLQYTKGHQTMSEI